MPCERGPQGAGHREDSEAEGQRSESRARPELNLWTIPTCVGSRVPVRVRTDVESGPSPRVWGAGAPPPPGAKIVGRSPRPGECSQTGCSAGALKARKPECVSSFASSSRAQLRHSGVRGAHVRDGESRWSLLEIAGRRAAASGE